VSELVIGGRRPNRHPRLRSAAIVLLLVALAALVSYLIFRRVVSYREPSGKMPDAPLAARTDGEPALTWGQECSLAHRGRVTVLRAVGKPHTLGACHGRMLGARVPEATSPLAAAIDAAVPRGGVLARMFRGPRLRWRYRLLDDGLPGSQLGEIGGLARGARRAGGPIDFEPLVRAQAALDLGEPPGVAPGARYGAVGRGLSFALVAAAGNKSDVPIAPHLIVGRSFSLLGAGDGGQAAARSVVVAMVKPEGGIPFATVTWPGMVGAVTGVNAEGIAVFLHPAQAADVRPTRAAQPAALVARDVLEKARTLDEAVKMVEQTATLGAAGFLLADGNRSQLAWVERSPSRTRVIRGPSPAVAGDFFTTETFLDDPDNDRARRTRPSGARAARAAELARRAPVVSSEQVVAILRDAAGAGGAALPAGHRAAIDDPEAVHTVVLDPVEMVLWVAEGPGAGGRFRAFDLALELRGQAGRPPPADIPPDPLRDGTVAEQVVAARRDLRAARQARADDSNGRARELAARALTRRPDLPEALLLAGELARAGGDEAAAALLFARYLASPDDLAAEEQVRALH
jgi:isopenicillin-N N-acyltransferase-like protein